VSFLNPAKRFEVIARDEFRVSQIICLKLTTGVLFPVLNKYPESKSILSNYLHEMIRVTKLGDEKTRLSIFVRVEVILEQGSRG
jgi:hypothetical protein